MSLPFATVRVMDQSPGVCFIDTETTSLRPDRRAWEVAVILRRPGLPDRPRRWFIAADDLDLGNADLAALRIGGFFDRHPDYQPRARDDNYGAGNNQFWTGDDYDDDGYLTGRDPDGHYYARPEIDVMIDIEELTRGAHLVGAVPGFDAEVLAARMRAHGICPAWHYHLQDFETLIAGYLAGQGKPVPLLPWRSDDLSRLIGVEPPEPGERHTAIGDATWGARVWDAIMGAPA